MKKLGPEFKIIEQKLLTHADSHTKRQYQALAISKKVVILTNFSKIMREKKPV